MKKVLSLLLVLCLLLPALAVAESIDLSALSFDQLIQLREQITRELTSRPEWKEVTVPIGLWKVGEDIPAGHWTITAADRGESNIKIGDILASNGREVDYFNSKFYGSFYYEIELTSPQYSFYDENKDISSFDIVLTDGLYIEINRAAVVFTPYIGKPSLGF